MYCEKKKHRKEIVDYPLEISCHIFKKDNKFWTSIFFKEMNICLKGHSRNYLNKKAGWVFGDIRYNRMDILTLNAIQLGFVEPSGSQNCLQNSHHPKFPSNASLPIYPLSNL